jgi:hypothetical protein
MVAHQSECKCSAFLHHASHRNLKKPLKMSEARPPVISVPERRSLDLILNASDRAELNHNFRTVEAAWKTLAATVAEHIAEATFIMGQPDLPSAFLKKIALSPFWVICGDPNAPYT